MNDRLHLTLSFGGSKTAAAIVSPDGIVARTERIEWSRSAPQSLEDLIALMAGHAKCLMERTGLTPSRVALIGVAWPGPGVGGEFEATFLPDCNGRQPLKPMLRAAFSEHIDVVFQTVPICVVLDAMAGAGGELLEGGVFHKGEALDSGLFLNLATGIAGALVEQGKVVYCDKVMGEAYGQFGRFLFRKAHEQGWVWRPTADGSVAIHSEDEIRWTHSTGGPALARRLSSQAGGPRDVGREKAILQEATREFYENPHSDLARRAAEAAREIGRALRCLLDVFAQRRVKTVGLSGGIGSFFGKPPGAETPDRWLGILQEQIDDTGARVCRSALGLDAEFLGLGPGMNLPLL